MKLKNALLLAFACLSLPMAAQDFTDKNAPFEKKLYLSHGDTLRYRLLTPEAEVQGKKYPLVLFLHGAGERGRDNELQLFHGAQMWLNPVNRMKHPAYVIFPQCPPEEFGVFKRHEKKMNFADLLEHPEPNEIGIMLKELLDTYLKNPQIDTKRIYIMGVSMGAMSTYDFAIRYPEIFAAAIPICGVVNPERLEAAKDVKFRIFHGDADSVVPVQGSRQAYRKLKELGAQVEYFEYPGVDHPSWHNAFREPSFMDWLFKQKK